MNWEKMLELGATAITGGVLGWIGIWIQTSRRGKIRRIVAEYRAGVDRALQDHRLDFERRQAEEKARTERDIAALNAALTHERERRILVHSHQFGKEFDCYAEIWEALVHLYDRAIAIRPISDSDCAMNERLDELGAAYQEFAAAFRLNRPFYDQAVHDSCLRVQRLARLEAVAGKGRDLLWRRNTVKYYEEGEAAAEELRKEMDRVAEAIRARIGMLEESAFCVPAEAVSARQAVATQPVAPSGTAPEEN